MASPTLLPSDQQNIISEPTLGDLIPQRKSPNIDVFLREARVSDIPQMAIHNMHAYHDTHLYRFICPRAAQYPEDMIRAFRQKLRRRLLIPNNITIVACLSSQPSKLVAFAQFTRLGNDAGAKRVVQSRGLWFLLRNFVLAWFFWVYDFVENFVWKDRITDFGRKGMVDGWFAMDMKRYWEEFPERENRWQANSVVVGPEWQGRGIGRMLMREVMGWAQEEMVPVGLTSSPQGEYLYRKLGFEMLGDFWARVQGEVGGGIMIWYPKAKWGKIGKSWKS